MEWEDEWFAADKLQHFLACFLITLLVASLAARSRHLFLRRRSIAIGSLSSLAAGAAKEVGDEIGIWRSAGGSGKDAAADIAGVLLSCLLFALSRRIWRRRSSSIREPDKDREISMV
ncbi:uncharacterized protein [Typha latifolia]|uniref:uncharacterized protein n=1 Tax=Typha latifolia TaxID=4733 RepID=UPI003C2BB709